MKAAIINEAMKKNVANTGQRPSRRSSNNAYGWFQTHAGSAGCLHRSCDLHRCR